MQRFLATLALLVSSATVASITVLVDFGQGKAPGKDTQGRIWNRVSGGADRLSRELRDSTGARSGIRCRLGNPADVTHKVGLNGPNRSGAKAPTGEAAKRGYPPFAVGDSLYGHPKLFGNRQVESAWLELSNLLPNQPYDLRIFASRLVGENPDCRETVYEAGGQETRLDPVNNTGNIVLLAGLKADVKGCLRVTLRPGDKNTNSKGFFYLGVLEITAPAASPLPPMGTGKNVLFLGNSFTMGSGGTPYLVAEVARLAGQTPPNVNMRAAGGKTLEWHRQNSLEYIAKPTDFFPEAGFQWDFVVMQEYSTRPTTHPKTGNIAAFLRDAPGLYAEVAKHSPKVVPILQETWARSPKHSFYPKGFKDPAAMQAQLRDSYAKAKAAIDQAIGQPITRIAPVGDSWELANWDDLHASDEYHANNRGSLLAALAMYATIYDDNTVSDIPELAQLAKRLHIDPKTLPKLTAAVDAALKAQRAR